MRKVLLVIGVVVYVASAMLLIKNVLVSQCDKWLQSCKRRRYVSCPYLFQNRTGKKRLKKDERTNVNVALALSGRR